MENLRKKYGQWGFVLGATDGIGKAFAEYFAKGSMDVILLGRREDKLQELAIEIESTYSVKTKIMVADLSDDDAAEEILEKVKGMDIGILNYVATFHIMGKYHKEPYALHKKVQNVNINTFSKLVYHYSGVFDERNRGAFVVMSSLTAFTGNPYNAEYGASKSYMQILTESIGYEFKDSNVDVICITAGTTKTPELLKNLPKGEAAAKADTAMWPHEVVEEGMAMLGKQISFVVGKHNRTAYDYYIKSMTRDEASAIFGGFFAHNA